MAGTWRPQRVDDHSKAISSHDLWIWHAFYGLACANNDINVLDQSPVFNDIYLGKSHDVPLQANGVTYKCGYYLTDGIYPPLSVFVKSFTCPNDLKKKNFKEVQESTRKDVVHVERTFGILKRRWQVLAVGARSYEVRRLQHIMYACIILHNIILEDEGRTIFRYNKNEVFSNVEGVTVGTQEYMENRREVHNRDIHHALHADLVEHVYRAHIQPPIEYCHDDLFDESDEDFDMFVKSEDFDDESDVQENDEDDEIDDEDDDSE
ncbi:uncharacterized protein LOC111891662 [Lactuca sativa]|uniref:uncharacterized protein LOC111891662 n=1 Tax=Lactuca sativa TaxID=4236 RepID=UPI000CD84FAC|nr:uncharacterized protein LOC111891662 [Lactuca sativa]